MGRCRARRRQAGPPQSQGMGRAQSGRLVQLHQQQPSPQPLRTSPSPYGTSSTSSESVQGLRCYAYPAQDLRVLCLTGALAQGLCARDGAQHDRGGRGATLPLLRRARSGAAAGSARAAGDRPCARRRAAHLPAVCAQGWPVIALTVYPSRSALVASYVRCLLGADPVRHGARLTFLPVALEGVLPSIHAHITEIVVATSIGDDTVMLNTL